MSSLADLMQAGGGERGAHLEGVVTGVVTNNQDPDKLGRIKVRFPWLSESDESWWARVAVPMAAKDAGTWFLPDVDDEVLVAFEHGDVRFPYVLGALWRDGAPPPQDNADGKNALREIRSVAGLSVLLDDTSGSERIVIADGAGKAKITVDAAGEAITVAAGNGVTMRAQSGTVTIEGADVAVKASSGKLTLEGAGVEITSKAGLKLEAVASVDIKGALINVG